MKSPENASSTSTLQRTSCFILAVVFLFGGLTGCDVMDPLATDGTGLDAAISHSTVSPDPLPNARPAGVAPYWYDLVGTWQIDGSVFDKNYTPSGTTVTFTIDQQMAVSSGCIQYGGTFSSQTEGALALADLRPAPGSCPTLKTPAVIEVLRTVTHYKRSPEGLRITFAAGTLSLSLVPGSKSQ